jgi:hypothetical protein
MEYAIREKKLWETVGLLNQKAVWPIEEEELNLVGRFNG